MKMNKTGLRRFASLVLSLVLCLGMALPALAEGTMKEELLASMAYTAKASLQNGDTDLGMYQNSRRVDAYTATPSSFDLRDYDFVPPITNQKSWGTCWGFASIGASEISILAKLKLTYEEYIEKYGKALDLSEKHLAWFGTSHLPELVEGEDYVFPTLESQAGEGVWLRDEEELGQAAHYNNGGFPMVASGIFAAGMGPVYEEDYPYTARDGRASTAADWTLDEEDRFQLTFELENSSILPSPSMRDANGNYIYNGYGTAAIKDELLSGRAVTIGYHADQAMDPEAQKNMFFDLISEMIELSDEESEFLKALFGGEVDMDSLTPGWRAASARARASSPSTAAGQTGLT